MLLEETYVYILQKLVNGNCNVNVIIKFFYDVRRYVCLLFFDNRF